MKIVELLHRPRSGTIQDASNARRAWSERRSWLVVLVDEEGRRGLGEASPLPGYATDDMAAAGRDLNRWVARLPIDLDPDRSLGVLADHLAEVASPSARCALETALLDLIGQHRGKPLWSVLGGREPEAVAVAGLITTAHPAEAVEQTGRLLARGIDTAKVKIGRLGGFDAELALGAAVRDAGIRHLRFDANGCLPTASLAVDLDRLARLTPELIEEPAPADCLFRLETWPEHLPLALDETLQRSDADQLIDRFAATGRLAALVLKPMVLGGVLPALERAEQAAGHGIGSIASHLFDGPIAWQAAAHLALALPGPRWAAGLDSHPGLAAWPTVHLPLLARSRIVPNHRPGLGLRAEDLA